MGLRKHHTRMKTKGRGQLWRNAVFDISTKPDTGRDSIIEIDESKQTQKSAEEKDMILNVLKTVMFFKKMEQFQVNNVAEAMWQEKFDAGSIITHPGAEKKEKANYFYIIKEGEVNI